MYKMIYSETCGCMVVKGFTLIRFVFKRDGSQPYKVTRKHYTWNEADALYYYDEVDGEDYFEELPKQGPAHSLTLLPRCRAYKYIKYDK